MFRIKICGITNVNDALMAARAGADAVGLNFFNKSRRFVKPEVAREIVSAMPADVFKVGVFVNHDAEQIATIANNVGLDCVQLHGDEHPELLSQLPSDVRIIRAHRCGPGGLTVLAKFLEECRTAGRSPDAVLLDADAGVEFGGTGQVADWSRIESERLLLSGLPLILAGGLTPENVGAAIAAVRPTGVDVASGVEREPRRKSPDRVTAFIAAAKQALGCL